MTPKNARSKTTPSGRFLAGSDMISRTGHADFSVVVKDRADSPKTWQWEIHRAGRNSPIKRSKVLFETATEADRAGNAALRLLLSEFPD